jgi:molybdopterin-synthase adenylyltransferase
MLPAAFPRRPRLRPFFHIVPLSGGRVQLRSAYRSLVISGAGAPELTRLMLPLLDGSRTPDEIVHACHGHAPEAVHDALALLQEKAVLEDAAGADRASLSPDAQERFADQLRLFSASVGNPLQCQADLQSKHVTLVGATPLGLAIGHQLAHSGIGAVQVVPTSDADAAAAMAYVQEANRNGAHGALRLSRMSEAAVDAIVGEACSDADLVIVPNDGPGPALNRMVNEVCLAREKPWLPVVLFGNDVGIGPLVVPGQTACFMCYELRMKGNLLFADEYVAFEDHLLKGLASDVAQGGLKVYAGVVAGITAIEAIKFLTKFTYPLALGRLIRFNFVNYQYMVHPVLRLPRCPRCGPVGPTVREWEL